MRVLALVVLIVIALAGASQVRAEEPVSGFSTEGTGVIVGEVTSDTGSPLAGVTVFATTPQGELTAVTDAKGKYRMDLGPEQGSKFVFVRRRALINGHTMRTAYEDGEESFDILEADKPKVMPRPTTGTNVVPEYSDAARDANVWTRAWLILDVDESGLVRRLKLINRPGHGLDDIAIRDAFKLRFTPAQNRVGKPVRTMVLWTYEWPPYWWMIDNKFVPGFVPEKAAAVPCQGTPTSQRVQRDCSRADLAAGQELPWVEAPSLPQLTPRAVVAAPAPRRERWYDDTLGWTLTGTGTVLLGLGAYLAISAFELEDEADAVVGNPVDAAQKRDTAEQRKGNALLVGGLGAVTLGLGVTRLVLHSDGTTTQVAVAGRF